MGASKKLYSPRAETARQLFGFAKGWSGASESGLFPDKSKKPPVPGAIALSPSPEPTELDIEAQERERARRRQRLRRYGREGTILTEGSLGQATIGRQALLGGSIA